MSKNTLLEMVNYRGCLNEDGMSWEHFMYMIETKENCKGQKCDDRMKRRLGRY